jgi:hypothetical protein
MWKPEESRDLYNTLYNNKNGNKKYSDYKYDYTNYRRK